MYILTSVSTESEEEKQVLREIGKQRMRLKGASLNTEQNQKFYKIERQNRRTKWVALKPEERELQHQRRREKNMRDGHCLCQKRRKHTVKHIHGVIATTGQGSRKERSALES